MSMIAELRTALRAGPRTTSLRPKSQCLRSSRHSLPDLTARLPASRARFVHTVPPGASSSSRVGKSGARGLGAGLLAAIACAAIYATQDSLHLDAPANQAKRLKKTAKPRLEEALARISRYGIETSTAEDVLTGFATAPGTTYPPSLPLAVVYPTSTEDVVEIVNACRESQVRT